MSFVKRKTLRAKFLASPGSSDFERLHSLLQKNYSDFYHDLEVTRSERIGGPGLEIERSDGFSDQEMILLVLRYLNVREVLKLSTVSKLLKSVCFLDRVWQDLYQREYQQGVFGKSLKEMEDGMWHFRFKERYTRRLILDVVYMKESDDLLSSWDQVILCIFDLYLFVYDYDSFNMSNRDSMRRYLLDSEIFPKPLRSLELSTCDVDEVNAFLSMKKKLYVFDTVTGEKLVLGMDGDAQRKNWHQLLLSRIKVLVALKNWENFKERYYIPDDTQDFIL